jgi:hypothetical protein
MPNETTQQGDLVEDSGACDRERALGSDDPLLLVWKPEELPDLLPTVRARF